MPIKKAAMKALRQAKKNVLRNKLVKNKLHDLIKRSKRSMAEKKLDETKNLLKEVVKTVDKAVKSKFLKQNTASRIKSRLAKSLREITKK